MGTERSGGKCYKTDKKTTAAKGLISSTHPPISTLSHHHSILHLHPHIFTPPLPPSTSSLGTGGHTSEVKSSRSNLGELFRDQYFLSRSITSCTDTGNGMGTRTHTCDSTPPAWKYIGGPIFIPSETYRRPSILPFKHTYANQIVCTRMIPTSQLNMPGI